MSDRENIKSIFNFFNFYDRFHTIFQSFRRSVWHTLCVHVKAVNEDLRTTKRAEDSRMRPVMRSGLKFTGRRIGESWRLGKGLLGKGILRMAIMEFVSAWHIYQFRYA